MRMMRGMNILLHMVSGQQLTGRVIIPTTHGFGGTLPACEIAPIADFARVLAFRLSPAFPVK